VIVIHQPLHHHRSSTSSLSLFVGLFIVIVCQPLHHRCLSTSSSSLFIDLFIIIVRRPLHCHHSSLCVDLFIVVCQPLHCHHHLLTSLPSFIDQPPLEPIGRLLIFYPRTPTLLPRTLGWRHHLNKKNTTSSSLTAFSCWRHDRNYNP